MLGVEAACGRAAVEAFQAAGAGSAFATTWDESKRRARLKAYKITVREEPADRVASDRRHREPPAVLVPQAVVAILEQEPDPLDEQRPTHPTLKPSAGLVGLVVGQHGSSLEKLENPR